MKNINILSMIIAACSVATTLSAASVDPMYEKANKSLTRTTEEQRKTALSVSELPTSLIDIIHDYFYSFENVGGDVRPILRPYTVSEEAWLYDEMVKGLNPLYASYISRDRFTSTEDALSQAGVLSYQSPKIEEDLGFCQDSMTSCYFKDGIHIATTKHYVNPSTKKVCRAYTALYVGVKVTNQHGEVLVLPAGSKIDQEYCSKGTRSPDFYNNSGNKLGWKNTPYRSGTSDFYLRNIEIIDLPKLPVIEKKRQGPPGRPVIEQE